MEIRLVTAAFRPYNPLFDRWANPLSSWEALSGEGDSRSEAEELKRKEADLPKIVPKVNSLEEIVIGSLSSGGPLEQAVFMLSKEKPSLEKGPSNYSLASSMSYSYPQRMAHIQNPIGYVNSNYENSYGSYEANPIYSSRQSNEFGFYAPLPVYPLELVLQRKSPIIESVSSPIDYAPKSQMNHVAMPIIQQSVGQIASQDYVLKLQVSYVAMPVVQQSNGQVSLYSGNYSIQNRAMIEPQVQSNPLLQRHVLEMQGSSENNYSLQPVAMDPSYDHQSFAGQSDEKTDRVKLQLNQPLFSRSTKDYQSFRRDPPKDPERQMFPDQNSSKKEKPYAMQVYSGFEPSQISQEPFYSQNPLQGFNLRESLPNSFRYSLQPNVNRQVISFPEVNKEYQSDRRLRPIKLRQQEQRPPTEPNQRVFGKELPRGVDSEIYPVQFKSYEEPRFETQLPIRADNDNRQPFESIDSVIETNDPVHKAREITKKYDSGKKFDSTTRKSLDDFVARAKELGYGNVSVFVYNTKTGEQYAVNADKMVATPSINKLPLAFVISYFIKEGKLDPNQKIKVQKNLVHDREKQTYEAFSEEGRELDYKTLMKWMVEGSINSATNHLLYFLGNGDYKKGMQLFKQTLEEFGLDSITIDSLYLRGHNYHANKASAKDLSKFMDILFNGNILDEGHRNLIVGHLENEQWTAGYRNGKALREHNALMKPTVTEKGMGIAGKVDDLVYSVVFNGSKTPVYTAPADKKHINNNATKLGVDSYNQLAKLFPILAKVADKPHWVVKNGVMSDSESPEEAVYRLLSERGRSVEMQNAQFYDFEKGKYQSDWIVVDKKNPERFIEYVIKKDNTIDILEHGRDFEYSKEFKRLFDNAKNKSKFHGVESKRIDLDKYRGRNTYGGAIVAEMIKNGKSMEESIKYASNAIVTGQRDSRYRGGVLVDKKAIVGNEFVTIESAVETKQTLLQKVASYFRA